MNMKRPGGVTLIAILALIGGLFGLCWPILAFTGSALFGGILGTVGAVAGIFLLVGPLLQLVFAYGAFKLRSWAWYLGLIASGITVLGVIINLIGGASIFSALCGSLLSVIIFIYLLMPNVRQAFGVGSQTPEAVEPPAPIETEAAAPPEEVASGEPTDSEEPASPVEPAAPPEAVETDESPESPEAPAASEESETAETAESGDEVEQ
jgi:hypothetical protein